MGILDRALNVGEGKQFRRYEQRVSRDQRLRARARARHRRGAARALDDLRERARGGESLDDLLPECFAIVREAGKRQMGMRHFDVQLIGGMVLHGGSIAEMKTGEGKTLTATLAVVLNTLAGNGVHVVTVNDYLARRDAEWMSRSMTRSASPSACCSHSSHRGEAHAYACDVTYGTNSEFGFDYLRDNMASSLEEKVQHGGRIDAKGGRSPPLLRDRRRGRQHPDRRGAHAADHLRRARAGGRPLRQVRQARAARWSRARPEGLDPRTKKEFVADFDYEFDEKHKTVAVTELGVAKAERFLGIDHLYRAENGHLVNHLIQALKAESLYKRDVDYAGRRRRGQDHRRVHRAHPRGAALVGGPASGDRGQGGRSRPGGEPDARDDHAAELLPPLRQALRHDRHGADRGDRVHEDLQAAGRPDPDQPADGPGGPQRSGLQDQGRQVVGGGTGDRRASPQRPAGARRHDLGRGLRAALASACKRRGIEHTVLNAKPEHAEREGEIIAEAGRPGAVTIATNMAGRGVDIKLGGNAEHMARLALAKLGLRPGDPGFDEQYHEQLPADRSRDRGRAPAPCSRPAASSSSAPSATSRGGSTTSCAAAPVARATPANPLLPVGRRRPDSAVRRRSDLSHS
jgi:preprotein translocase subunit SecA